MRQLSASDLKTRGVSAIEAALVEHSAAIISVRSKDRFVVMNLAQYHYLRECELDATIAQSRKEIAAGDYVIETAAEHIARLEAMLKDEA
jgi:PHD/YefM family antitoxin component YafN of YafNO toxin-antitoxin module